MALIRLSSVSTWSRIHRFSSRSSIRTHMRIAKNGVDRRQPLDRRRVCRGHVRQPRRSVDAVLAVVLCARGRITVVHGCFGTSILSILQVSTVGGAALPVLDAGQGPADGNRLWLAKALQPLHIVDHYLVAQGLDPELGEAGQCP